MQKFTTYYNRSGVTFETEIEDNEGYPVYGGVIFPRVLEVNGRMAVAEDYQRLDEVLRLSSQLNYGDWAMFDVSGNILHAQLARIAGYPGLSDSQVVHTNIRFELFVEICWQALIDHQTIYIRNLRWDEVSAIKESILPEKVRNCPKREHRNQTLEKLTFSVDAGKSPVWDNPSHCDECGGEYVNAFSVFYMHP